MAEVLIKKINVRAVLAPLIRPITTSVTTIPKAPLLLIDIECSDGIVGRSYLFGYTPLSLDPLSSLLGNIAEILINKPITPTERMNEMESVFRLLGRQGLVAMALAGIDMALWDAFAKSKDVSVAVLIGATNKPIPCYDSHGVFVPNRDAAMIEKSLSDGFQAMKFKVGGDTLQNDVHIISEIREIIGPEIKLMIDYNQSLSAPEAVRRILRFEDEGFDLTWVEEPVGAEDFAAHKTVRSKISTAIQTGENWWMPQDAARAVQADICDHAMLDIMKIGGITGWKSAAAYTEAKSLPVSSHIFIEASSHAMAATSNAFLLEYLDVSAGVLNEPYEIIDGCIVPRGPGLGLEWDEKAVVRHSV